MREAEEDDLTSNVALFQFQIDNQMINDYTSGSPSSLSAFFQNKYFRSSGVMSMQL